MEMKCHKQLQAFYGEDVEIEYEPHKIPYTISTTYSPDFILLNGIVVETKGYFPPDERKKMLLIHKQHPELDVRVILYRHTDPILKGSPTTYAMWCSKNGIKWGTPDDLLAWAKEPKDERRIKALKAIGYELE